MGFHAIHPATNVSARPQRAPAKTVQPPAPSALQHADDRPAAVQSHEFPDRYENNIGHGTFTSLPRLASGLERLIELAGSRMGCPHEEILALKAAAMDDPVMVSELCQHIFDTRERPLREALNPLDVYREPGHSAFWIEGLFGKSVAVTSAAAAAPYDGQRIELYDPNHTPFAQIYNPVDFFAKLAAKQAATPAPLAFHPDPVKQNESSLSDAFAIPLPNASQGPPAFDQDWGV